jgi:hypothetical protein
VVVIPDKYAPVTDSDESDQIDKTKDDEKPAELEAKTPSSRSEDETDRIIR